MFPVTTGGIFDEFVNCTLYDEVNDLIIVAGETLSATFGPNTQPHGFAYALDNDGNWIWGYYYYNVGTGLAGISGCKFDQNGDLLFFWKSQEKPYILKINTAEPNTTLSYVTLSPIKDEDAEEEAENYFELFHAFYHDIEDPYDGLAYYYLSFLLDKSLYIVKVQAEDMIVTESVKYNFEGDETNVFQDINIPRFMDQDPDEKNSLLLIG